MRASTFVPSADVRRDVLLLGTFARVNNGDNGAQVEKDDQQRVAQILSNFKLPLQFICQKNSPEVQLTL